MNGLLLRLSTNASPSLNLAVTHTLVLRLWQSCAGVVGLLLVGVYFTPQQQGFYYTFASLIALQSFVELGLYVVISTLASHEWAHLRFRADGTIEGDARNISRIVSLGRFIIKWYSLVALVFFVFVGIGGWYFLNSSVEAEKINWELPWLLHVIFSALLLWCTPFFSLLDGCDQVSNIAIFRLKQSLASNGVFWLLVLSGASLWAIPMLSCISLLCCVGYCFINQRSFLKLFLSDPLGEKINWRIEILPMQWRLAVQAGMHYFVFGMLTPVMFHYHGSVVAGQMGMTLQVIGAAQTVSLTWLAANSPQFAISIAKNESEVFYKNWRTAMITSILVLCGCGVVLMGCLYLLRWQESELANRLLDLESTSLLFLGTVFSLWGASFTVYLRAHKIERMWPVALMSGLVMGLLVWQLGMRFGPLGASLSYCLVFAFVSFPMTVWIWINARRHL